MARCSGQRHFIWTLREPLRAFRNWLRLLRPGGRVVAIAGFWFDQADTYQDVDGDPPDLFEQHYTRETRSALPVMQMTAVEPVAALFEEAGFEQVTVGDLGAVHTLADQPPSSPPW